MDLRLFKSSCNIYADSPFCQDSLAAAPRPARGGTRHTVLCELSVSYAVVHCQAKRDTFFVGGCLKKDKFYAAVILLQDRQIVYTVVFLFRGLFQIALTKTWRKKEDTEVYSRSNICRMVHKPRLTSMTTRTIIYKQASKQASKQADTAHFLIGDNIKHTQAHSARFAAGRVCLFACRIQAM